MLRFSAARVAGMMASTCDTQARAAAQATLFAHKGSMGCRWGSKTPETRAGSEDRDLWTALHTTVSGWFDGEATADGE